MKVTFQNNTQNVPQNSWKSFHTLQTFVKGCFPNLPTHLEFLCQIPNEETPMLVKTEEDFKRMMTKLNGATTCLEVRERNEESGEYEYIGEEEKFVEIKCQKEEEGQQNPNFNGIDSIICEKLEKLIPGMISKVREELKEGKRKMPSPKNQKFDPFEMSEGILSMAMQMKKEQTKEYERMIQKMMESDIQVENMQEQENYLNNEVCRRMMEMEQERQRNCELWNMGENTNRREERDSLLREMHMMSSKVKEVRNQKLTTLRKCKSMFENQLAQNQNELMNMMTCVMKDMKMVKCEPNISNHQRMMETCMDISRKLRTHQKNARTYNERERMFNFEPTDYSTIECCMKEIMPYESFWKISNCWYTQVNEWMNCPINCLKNVTIPHKMDECVWGLECVMKDLECTETEKMCQKVKQDIRQHEKFLPLVNALNVNGMKERHWKMIEEKTGIHVQPNCTFQNMVMMGLLNHVPACKEVAEKAEREYQICENLKNFQRNWVSCKVCMKPYNENMCMIDNCEELCQMVENDFQTLRQMEMDPHSNICKTEISQWRKMLETICQMMENCHKFQQTWRYVEPICTPHFCSNFPKIGEQFTNVTKMWKEITYMMELSTNIKSICCSEELCTKFNTCCNQIDQVQREMNCMLEEKKRAFPRFYFLDQDSLLDLYCNPNTTQQLNKYVCKIFENIRELQFDESSNIVAMMENQNERMTMVRNVPTCNRPLETILKELENVMRETVRHELKNAVTNYPENNRNNWIKTTPSQCVQTSSQIWWTSSTQKAIENKKLPEHQEKYQNQLKELVKMTREELTRSVRTTVNNLIILEVHSNDIINELKHKKTENTDQINWTASLRQYWNQDNCEIKCVNTSVQYAYEYIGNCQRLVVTPLTDRCYRSLMTSFNMNLGGAPSGPAGTGKCETTKDLARCLGQLCMVFNCSDQMNYKSVQQIVKGTASNGNWCCFDEFNRISIEVLATVYEQMKMVYEAKTRKENKLRFEQEEINFNPNCFFVLTMNPGYAGRTQLPENLKTCFRPIPMMVPDYCLIAEIMMYSQGILKASTLARKLVNVFKMCSEQLSSQCHYDFGMRAVKSVLHLCGMMKTKNPNMDEEELLYQAMRKIMCPKLVNNDSCLFENIMRDLFPTMKASPTCNPEMNEHVKRAFERNNLHPTPYMVEKVFEMEETTQVRHGFMLIGETKRGKTCIQQVYCEAMESCHEKKKIHRHIINPKSMNCQQLYGQMFNKEWKDGVLTHLMRQCSADSNENNCHWIVFDGPIDPEWIESMNTVLDDNKMLQPANGERIRLSPQMRMTFELDNLLNATPATVSRCGMVCLDSEIKMDTLVQCWMKNLPENMKKDEKMMIKIKYLFEEYLSECMNFIRCQMMVPTTQEHMIHSMMRLFNCQINKFMEVNRHENLENCLVDMFHWCLVWSIGNQLNLEQRNRFNIFMREMCAKKMRKVFPEEGSVYDYHYDMKNMCFMNYCDMCEFNETSLVCDLVVPTKDFVCNMNLAQMLVNNNCPIMFMGPMSSGKSLLCQEFMKNMSNSWNFKEMPFSRKTIHQDVQNMMEENMIKRRKNVYCLDSCRRTMLMIDDMNMPRRDRYNDHSAVEMLRWMMEYQCVWDYNTLDRRMVQDMMIMGTVCSNQYEPLTKRFTSKFNMIGCPEISDFNMNHIFQTMLYNRMKKYPQNIRCMCPEISETCVNVLNFFRNNYQNENCCPLTIREPLRVVQSICSLSPKDIYSSTDMTNLCCNELMRVFCDRLPSQTTRNRCMNEIRQTMRTMKNMPMEECQNSDEIVFSDYMESRHDERRSYNKVYSMKKFMEKTANYIQEYNAEMGYKQASNIVMFPEVCQNISRICRVLRQTQGNMVLIGSRGCGKKSMTRIASYIMRCQMEECQEMPNCTYPMWENWLKSVMMRTVSTDKRCCVMFNGCDLSDEMMTTLCTCLKMDNISCLFTPEEMTLLENDCKEECQERKMSVNRRNMMQVCMERLRRNFHCVVCMNPQENNFNQRIREFPTLMNESTVNWVQNWSVEGLTTIGRKQMMMEMENLPENMCWNSMVETCQRIHSCVEECCPQLGKNYYFCPSSFVEFVEMYKKLCCRQTENMRKELEKTECCMKKLTQLEESISQMRCELRQCLKTSPQPTPISTKIEKCQTLLNRIIERKCNWEEKRQHIQNCLRMTYGNCMMCAAMMTYGGMMNAEWRERMVKMWRNILCEMRMKYCEDWQECCEEMCCMNMRENRDMNLTENMMIIENTNRIPMLVDPQNQISTTMCNMLKNCEEELCVYNINESDCMRNVKMSMSQGKWVLIEGVNKNIPSVVHELRKMQPMSSCKNRMMISTNMTNLTMPVSMMSQVCVINCTMTNRRMENMLLCEMMNVQHSNLCSKRREARQSVQNYRRMLTYNDNCLMKQMSEAQGSILEDQQLAQYLCCYQQTCDQMKRWMNNQQTSDCEYRNMMEKYRPVVRYTSMLYSCMQKMQTMNPLARNSCEWFTSLFLRCVKNSPMPYVLEKRISTLNEWFTSELYKNVACQLFENERMIFSFLIACTIMRDCNRISQEQWNFFVMQNYSDVKMIPNPMKCVPDQDWVRIYPQFTELQKIDNFNQICQHYMKNEDSWTKMTQLPCHQMFQMFPEPYNSSLNMFQKMMVIRILCPQNVMDCVRMTIEKVLGKEYVNPSRKCLINLCRESTNMKPLLVIKDTNCNMTNELNECVKEMNMMERCHRCFVGQGRVPEVKEKVRNAMNQGQWIMIEDCHLHPYLICEVWCLYRQAMRKNIHKDFRMWFITNPTSQFPNDMVENCLKISMQNQERLNELMMQTYERIDEKDVMECNRKEQYMRMIFACSFLHAKIIQRRRYGSLGMNIPYEWRMTDFEACVKMIRIMLNNCQTIQWELVRYMVAEISYGGRITDDKDRRLMNQMVENCLHPDVLKQGYKFCETVCQPQATNLQEYREYINTLPPTLNQTEIGLPEMAEPTRMMMNGFDFTRRLCPMKERMTDENERRIVMERCMNLEKMLPTLTSWEEVMKRYPMCYEEPMNVILVQEVRRYQILLQTIRNSLCRVMKMMRQNMTSPEVEEVWNCLIENQTVSLWNRKSFPSMKPLSWWMQDLRQRVRYMQRWVDEGCPKCLDISMLFFPQGFFSCMIQKYSRKHCVPIESVQMEFKYMNMQPSEITSCPEEGCYTTGIYMQGARWNPSQMKCVSAPETDVNCSRMPVVHFVPCTNPQRPEKCVNCPLYKTLPRRGVLSTTGHSTNFVLFMNVPTDRSQRECVEWGMAMFLSLNH